MRFWTRRADTRYDARPFGRGDRQKIATPGLQTILPISAGEILPIASFSQDKCLSLLEGDGWDTTELMDRAHAGMQMLAEGCKPIETEPGRDGQGSVLATIGYASECDADRNALHKMLFACALAEHAGGEVAMITTGNWPVKAHRRIVALAREAGVRVVESFDDPRMLLSGFATVFAADDEMGFLALMLGHRVRCFRPSFYAGWGLTRDEPTIARRRANGMTRERLFAAVCLLATRYSSPYTGAPCTFEQAYAIVSDLRRAIEAKRGIAVCLGMSFWKQRRIRDMLTVAGRAPRFRRSTAAAISVARKDKGAIAVWAAREPADLEAAAAAAGVKVIHIEDGFVRSVGLGADFMPAASIVLDREGIYFDPSRPSGLDTILTKTAFSMELIERSRQLIRLMVQRGITKYNVGGAMPDIAAPAGRRVLFVPGQVENDRSVALGGAGIQRNIDLLRRVRALNPDAFILYKPHPDVDAGHRPGAVSDKEVLAVADQVIRGISSDAIISSVDEVHTLTSLAGFEALIRGVYVVTYGKPFYSGWGLTKDFAPVPHRNRRLTLEQLVAGALILYPSYFDPVARLPCGPEVVIERLSRPDVWRPSLLITLRRFQGTIMRHFQRRRSNLVSKLPIEGCKT